MKKALITITAIAGILAAATTVSAAGISLEDAQKKALEAVNVEEAQVVFLPGQTDEDDGRQVYEVKFFVPGELVYEFDIDAETGAVIEQDIELWEAEDDAEYAEYMYAAEMETNLAVDAEAVEGEVTQLQAKMIALVDAGVKADEVIFTKCEKDFDDGVSKYDVELKLKDGTEYEYEINAADGRIIEKDVDRD